VNVDTFGGKSSDIQFILASATIGNPIECASKLISRPAKPALAIQEEDSSTQHGLSTEFDSVLTADNNATQQIVHVEATTTSLIVDDQTNPPLQSTVVEEGVDIQNNPHSCSVVRPAEEDGGQPMDIEITEDDMLAFEQSIAELEASSQDSSRHNSQSLNDSSSSQSPPRSHYSFSPLTSPEKVR